MLIRCPTCQKQLQVPDTAVGAKVRCPACQAVFAAAPPAPSAESPPAAAPAPPAPPPQPTVEQARVCPACQKPVQVADEHKGQQLACPSCGAIFVVTLFDAIKLVQSANPAADEPAPFDFNELTIDETGGAMIRTPVPTTASYQRAAAWFFHASAVAVGLNIVVRLIAAAMRNDDHPGALMMGCILSVASLVPIPFFIAAGNEVRHLERRSMTITGIVFAFLGFISASIVCCPFALDPAVAMGRHPAAVVVSVICVSIQSMLTLLAGSLGIMALTAKRS